MGNRDDRNHRRPSRIMCTWLFVGRVLKLHIDSLAQLGPTEKLGNCAGMSIDVGDVLSCTGHSERPGVEI